MLEDTCNCWCQNSFMGGNKFVEHESPWHDPLIVNSNAKHQLIPLKITLDVICDNAILPFCETWFYVFQNVVSRQSMSCALTLFGFPSKSTRSQLEHVFQKWACVVHPQLPVHTTRKATMTPAISKGECTSLYHGEDQGNMQ